jgi:hypothetical protein
MCFAFLLQSFWLLSFERNERQPQDRFLVHVYCPSKMQREAACPTRRHPRKKSTNSGAKPVIVVVRLAHDAEKNLFGLGQGVVHILWHFFELVQIVIFEND